MAISVEVKPEVRGDAFNHEEDYLVIGTSADENMTRDEAIQAVISATPDDVNGILRANATIREWWPAPGRTIAVVTMQYGELTGGGGGLIEQTEAIYEFRYQAPSEHVYYSLATTSYGTNPPDYNGRIKVDPWSGETEGITLPAGNTTNVWRLNTSASFVDATYEALVESLMGAVNSVEFFGRPAGTMRFVECDSQVTSGNKVSLTWGFQFSPNRTGLSFPRIVGSAITGVNVGGHELIWQLDEMVDDPTTKKRTAQARAIYVEQVFETADLNELNF